MDNTTTLSIAYERLDKLDIELTQEQFSGISTILFDLSNTQFNRGLDSGIEIFNKKYV